MARPRRRPPSTSSGNASYKRRNERARALGYRNYYDQRLHAGAPPGAALPPKGSAERSRLRGHRGGADLVRSLKPGDVIVVPDGIPDVAKDSKGRYAKIDLLVLRDSGRTDRYTVRRRSYESMAGLLEQTSAKGAVFSPSPSLDLRRLVRVADRPDRDDDYAMRDAGGE